MKNVKEIKDNFYMAEYTVKENNLLRSEWEVGVASGWAITNYGLHET